MDFTRVSYRSRTSLPYANQAFAAFHNATVFAFFLTLTERIESRPLQCTFLFFFSF